MAVDSSGAGATSGQPEKKTLVTQRLSCRQLRRWSDFCGHGVLEEGNKEKSLRKFTMT